MLVARALSAGGPGNALHFDGVNDYVVVPSTNAPILWPMTVTAWVRIGQTNTGGDLLYKAPPPVQGVPYWHLSHFDGTFYAGIERSFAAVEVQGNGSVADGAWHHVAFTVYTNGAKLYVDGISNAVAAWSGTPSPPNASLELYIGGPNPFNGDLDEITLWNAELTQSQIQANMHRSLTGSEPGLVVYYRCDETGGTTLFDSAPASGNNDGILTNGASFVASGVFPFAPAAETLGAAGVGPGAAMLNGSANPEGTNTTAWFEWGTTSNYGNATLPQPVGSGATSTNFSQIVLGLAPSSPYHFRAVASNSLGSAFGADQVFLTLLSGDLNGDGHVDLGELNVVLSNYFADSPWLRLTNPAGLGGTNVTFTLTNSLAGAFSVQYSTNLQDWFFLGHATPRYEFIDTNAPAVPQRSYRLRWP